MSLKIEVERRDDGYTRSLIEGDGGSKDLRRLAEGLLSQADFMDEIEDGIDRDDEDDGLNIPEPIPNHVVEYAIRRCETRMRWALWAVRVLAAPVAATPYWSCEEADKTMRRLADLYPAIVEALDGKAPGRRVCGEHEDGA